MVNEIVEKFVEKHLKTLFKSQQNFAKLYEIKLFNVYKASFHQLFQTFSTVFYTVTPPLNLSNYFHYSTYPTTITTKYIK